MSTQYHGESQASAAAASEAIDIYYTTYSVQNVALNDAMDEDAGYEAVRFITREAIRNAMRETVGSLDGSTDAAEWLTEGYTLSVEDVAWIRSLVVPA